MKNIQETQTHHNPLTHPLPVVQNFHFKKWTEEKKRKKNIKENYSYFAFNIFTKGICLLSFQTFAAPAPRPLPMKRKFLGQLQERKKMRKRDSEGS